MLLSPQKEFFLSTNPYNYSPDLQQKLDNQIFKEFRFIPPLPINNNSPPTSPYSFPHFPLEPRTVCHSRMDIPLPKFERNIFNFDDHEPAKFIQINDLINPVYHSNPTPISMLFNFDNEPSLPRFEVPNNDSIHLTPVKKEIKEEKSNDLTMKILSAMENDLNQNFAKKSFDLEISPVKNEIPEGKMNRKEFRETIGREIYEDIISEKYSYDEIIDKYKSMYPQYAHKFTKNFCSKIRCGRIMNQATKLEKRRVCDGDPKIKRIKKRSPKNNWQKMTDDLFKKMIQFEKDNPHIRQSDIQKIFNINRSTYWRWKKKSETN